MFASQNLDHRWWCARCTFTPTVVSICNGYKSPLSILLHSPIHSRHGHVYMGHVYIDCLDRCPGQGRCCAPAPRSGALVPSGRGAAALSRASRIEVWCWVQPHMPGMFWLAHSKIPSSWATIRYTATLGPWVSRALSKRAADRAEDVPPSVSLWTPGMLTTSPPHELPCTSQPSHGSGEDHHQK